MSKTVSQSAIWRASDYAESYFKQERPFLDAGLRQTVGPSVLQLGDRLEQTVMDALDLPFLLRTDEQQSPISDVIVDPAFLPFAPDSFSTVVLPHVLERHKLPHQVLREAHRVLMSEGHIVITGFNPVSFISAQRLLRPSAVCPGRYYSVRRVIDWLQLLGFEVVASSMFQYSPLFKSERLRSIFHFFESIGDRWLPMAGGGYMISAKKREAAGTLVGRVKFKPQKRKLASSVAARSSSKIQNDD